MKIQFLLLLETIEQNSTFREKALHLQFSSDEGPSLKMTSSVLLQPNHRLTALPTAGNARVPDILIF